MEESQSNSLAVALFSEILTNDQLIRSRLSRVLPKGMEISHFAVLNHLARTGEERSPAQLAKSFHVTRGAMTNTLSKLEWAGYVHIRPDWEDARRRHIGHHADGVGADCRSRRGSRAREPAGTSRIARQARGLRAGPRAVRAPACLRRRRVGIARPAGDARFPADKAAGNQCSRG